MRIKEKTVDYFIMGIISAVDLSGSSYRSRRNFLAITSKSRQQLLIQLDDVNADVKALRADWDHVGSSIRKAIEER